MSSSSPGTPQRPQGDLQTREALIIGASLIAMLVVLAVIRFGCNILIDVCILDEIERARRSVAEVLRRLFPWWHVRTQPTPTAAAAVAASTTTTNAAGTTAATAAASSSNVELIATGNKSSSSPEIINAKSRMLTLADLQQWRERYGNRGAAGDMEAEAEDSTSSHSLLCSICLHELLEGDCAYVADCQHIFHKDCMVQWVESKGLDCPNCRFEIVPFPFVGNDNDAGS